jgi:acetyl-CoA acyltransferase
MPATMDAAPAIMTGEVDIMISGGCEDMEKIPMGNSFDMSPRPAKRYDPGDLAMGVTAEKVAEMYNLSVDDMVAFACWYNPDKATNLSLSN